MGLIYVGIEKSSKYIYFRKQWDFPGGSVAKTPQS